MKPLPPRSAATDRLCRFAVPPLVASPGARLRSQSLVLVKSSRRFAASQLARPLASGTANSRCSATLFRCCADDRGQSMYIVPSHTNSLMYWYTLHICWRRATSLRKDARNDEPVFCMA